jgi:hypothetical protein
MVWLRTLSVSAAGRCATTTCSSSVGHRYASRINAGEVDDHRVRALGQALQHHRPETMPIALREQTGRTNHARRCGTGSTPSTNPSTSSAFPA